MCVRLKFRLCNFPQITRTVEIGLPCAGIFDRIPNQFKIQRGLRSMQLNLLRVR